MDFYRGALSARRLRVLLRQLPHDSALTRALNGGNPGWSVTDHLIADRWAQKANEGRKKGAKLIDHPKRKAMEERARQEAKRVRVSELHATYKKRKRAYGLEV
ncbi:hypothetical protein A5762_15265 [Mycolicibacterium elephantis]|nr:hypothetical protein A5762_15265 [Mycolicibacterium elephantis]